ISPVKNSTSVPHTPTRHTSTTTSSGAGTGGSTSWTSHSPGPTTTNALTGRRSASRPWGHGEPDRADAGGEEPSGQRELIQLGRAELVGGGGDEQRVATRTHEGDARGVRRGHAHGAQ